MMTPPLFNLLTVFVFGLCIGSFLNVCIYRIPQNLSIVRPRSRCPKCGYQIPFYDNIPLVSYILLKGRCRNCQNTISFRYPMIELMSGLLAVSTFLRFGLSVEGVIYYAFIEVLLMITFIDIDHRIIPDSISLPGIPINFIASFFISSVTWKEALIGILVGGGSLFIVASLYHLITGREGMGGGDIKLLAMIGALIGWKGVLYTIFVSSAIGTVVGIIFMILKHGTMKLAIPFGPFLAIGAISYVLFGKELIRWYFLLTY